MARPSGNKSIQEPIPLRSAVTPNRFRFYQNSIKDPGLFFPLFLSFCVRFHSLAPPRSILVPSPLPAYAADILYISVRLLAPYKSIFTLSSESNLSVSAGSRPQAQDRETLLNTKQIRPSYGFAAGLRVSSYEICFQGYCCSKYAVDDYMANSYCSR